MKNLTSLWRRATNEWWKRVLMAPVIVVAVLLAVWGLAEGVYQMKTYRLSSAVDEIGRVSIVPAGGVATYSYVKAPHFTDSLLCIDNGPCPSVTKGWLIPIDPKRESTFLHEALQKAGYQGILDNTPSPEANTGGTKNGQGLNISFYPLGSQHPPYPAPAGEEWKLIYASAD